MTHKGHGLAGKTLTSKAGPTHQRGALMPWTVLKILMILWMLQMVLQFGGSAIPLVLVISLAVLLFQRLQQLVIRRTSTISGRLHESAKTGRFSSYHS